MDLSSRYISYTHSKEYISPDPANPLYLKPMCLNKYMIIQVNVSYMFSNILRATISALLFYFLQLLIKDTSNPPIFGE